MNARIEEAEPAVANKPDGDMRLVFALLIIATFGTCASVNATEDMALAACYEAGFSPGECDR